MIRKLKIDSSNEVARKRYRWADIYRSAITTDNPLLAKLRKEIRRRDKTGRTMTVGDGRALLKKMKASKRDADQLIDLARLDYHAWD
jgi:hypothetical protein